MPSPCQHTHIMDTLTVALQRAKRRRQIPPPAACRQLRERLGLTQGDVAQALGVDRASISRYEAGARVPRGPIAEAYIELLDRLAREGLEA